MGAAAEQRYAFDFIAAGEPERFPVVAARGGTVIGHAAGRQRRPLQRPARRPAPDLLARRQLRPHRPRRRYLGPLPAPQARRALVRRGDVVSVGQPIGTAGSSGWTDGTSVWASRCSSTPAWNEWGRRLVPGQSLPSRVRRRCRSSCARTPTSWRSRPTACPGPATSSSRATPDPASSPSASGRGPRAVPASRALQRPVSATSALPTRPTPPMATASISRPQGLEATPVARRYQAADARSSAAPRVRGLRDRGLGLAWVAPWPSASRSMARRTWRVHSHLPRHRPGAARSPTQRYLGPIIGPNDVIGRYGGSERRPRPAPSASSAPTPTRSGPTSS